MTKSLVWAPTHSDLMKLSWFEMNWEEGYGLLSLRIVQMPRGMQALVGSEWLVGNRIMAGHLQRNP